MDENNQNTENLSKKERRELKRQMKNKEAGQGKREKLIKRISLWAGVAILIASGIFAAVKFGGNAVNSNTQTASLTNPVSGVDWIKGNTSSKVVLIEYSDFQCPACGAYYPLVKQLGEDYKEKIQIVYRHFPLPQHSGAKPAAFAAEAAGKQGKFWEMHNMIFDNQKNWSEKRNTEEIFASYAEKLQLDMNKYKNDISSKEIKDKVEQDYLGGIGSKVNSTPTFFLNGKTMQNPKNYDEFKNLIEEAIRANS